jgi:P4 family phage/plasmid primase-like protien
MSVTASQTTAHDAALTYADRGWKVLPIPRGRKYPRFEKWPSLATTDPEVIEDWWGRWPSDGVGIACGEVSGLFVIDVDVANGKVGAKTLADLEAIHGELPETYTVRTPTGGWHFYFRYDPARPVGMPDLGLDVNTRGDGGQVVAPPTIHPDTGTPYEVYNDAPVADVPGWVLDILLAEPKAPQAAPVDRGDKGDEDGPAKRFAEAHTWDDLLTADGWTLHHVKKGTKHWTRPGKDKRQGSSATTGHQGRDCLKVFTSSVPGLTEKKAYSKFGYYAATRHGDDRTAAARQLLEDESGTDLVGWIGGGGDRSPAPLRPPVPPDEVPTDVQGADGFHLTDVGNAARLAHRHGDRLRYVPRRGQWLVWDGRRWVTDHGATQATRCAASLAEDLWRLVPTLTGDERKRHVKHATACEDRRKIESAVKLAEAALATSHDDLDVDPWLLNVANGTIDLRTGELSPHDPARLITKLAPVDYDPDAEAPTWQAFIDRILPDPTVADFVQRAVGYSLTGHTGEQVLMVAHGDGANGKSTLFRMVAAMLGDYATIAPRDLLIAGRYEAHPTGLTKLHGARFAAAVETEADARLAEAQVKTLTGGDPLTARRMREDFWEFIPTHKLWLAANHRPRITGEDHGIWRRIRLVPFTETIPEAEQDPHLVDKLTAELPGVLAWAVDGCLAWQDRGLDTPPAVAAAVEQYRREEDWLVRFTEDKDLAFGDGSIAAATLATTYRDWCAETGEHVLGTKAFGAKLRTRGCEPVRSGGHRIWRGIYAQK